MAFSFQPKTAGIDGLIFCFDGANTKSYVSGSTTIYDLSLSAGTGSLLNGGLYTGSFGGGIWFDATNDYIDFQDIPYRISSSNFTLETVFYFDGNDYTNSPIFTKRNPNAFYNQWGINISSGDFYIGGTGKVLTSFLRYDQSNDSQTNDRKLSYTLPTAAPYHVVVTNQSASGHLYVNGVLQSSSFAPQPNATYIVSGRNIRLANNYASSYFRGSIFMAKMYNRTLSPTEVLQNYNAICGRFGKTPTITDGDALSFVNAANISNETQQSAINTLVTDLKGAGLWSKMKAIYPFVGGTAASHKWNLKDPRDADAAFRLTFSGGWTHSSTGAKANGTNGYANTYLSANTMGQNSVHLSVYIRENISGFMADIGHVGNSSQNTAALYIFTREGVLLPTTDSFTAYGLANQTNALVGIRAAVSTSAGHTMVTRTSSTLQSLYKNGLSIGTSTNASVSPTSNVIYISALNFVALGTIDYYSSRQVALATIGDGLTDTDAANLYTIVQKYQTTLGRQV